MKLLNKRELNIEEIDPLEILVVPHEVIKWQERKGLIMKKYFSKQLTEQRKRIREKDKFVIKHNKVRLAGLFDTEKEAQDKIDEIIGNKRKCIENSRIYKIIQL